VTTVEFAIVAVAVLLVLFAVIEVGRAFFVMNGLNEVSRRAARFAAVCSVNDPAIIEVALFNAPGGGTVSNILFGLQPENISVEYLMDNGDPITDPVANFSQIRFVRATIVDFAHEMLIPFGEYIFTAPGFATTLRRESLGVPREGTVEPC
jgi:hypothetical protein